MLTVEFIGVHDKAVVDQRVHVELCLLVVDFHQDSQLTGRQGAGTRDRKYVAVIQDGDGADQPDHKAADQAIKLLRAHKDEPFVLAVGFVRPHYPHVAPERSFKPYPHEKITLPERVSNDWDDIPAEGIAKVTSKNNGIDRYPENQKRMWAAYYASVTFMDEQVGRVLDELERLGLDKNTAVIFTSDHGYHLGEHDFWLKTNLHEEITHVPLMVSVPGMAPSVSSSIVELVDVYPTVMELVGRDVPKACHGHSLMPILKDPSATLREYAFSYNGKQVPSQFSLRGKRWAFMKYREGEELYDMDKDPGQFTNLAKEPDHAALVARLRSVVEEKRRVFPVAKRRRK